MIPYWQYVLVLAREVVEGFRGDFPGRAAARRALFVCRMGRSSSAWLVFSVWTSEDTTVIIKLRHVCLKFSAYALLSRVASVAARKANFVNGLKFRAQRLFGFLISEK